MPGEARGNRQRVAAGIEGQRVGVMIDPLRSRSFTGGMQMNPHGSWPYCPPTGSGLELLQEIDEFLQDHEEWTRLLDGQVLNP